jgi:hypothetical protein
MTVPRLFAIALIFGCCAFAWLALGGSIVVRTGETDARLSEEVESLWGGRHDQIAPSAWHEMRRVVTEDVQDKDDQGRMTTRQVTKTVTDRIAIPFRSSRLNVDIGLEHRKKGLLWYDTYSVGFKGKYRLINADPLARAVFVHFDFPSTKAIYDAFTFQVNGREVAPVTDMSAGITARAEIPAGGEAVVEVGYRSRGLGVWTYSLSPTGVAQTRDFELDMRTDFSAIDFPAGTISPTTKSPQDAGWRLTWGFESLVTGQKLGIDPPNRLNPGPLAARITFFAPVSLLFFFTVIAVLGVLTGRSLHPMNYFFLAAAFFAFHLLLAYLVDHVDIHAAFAVASLVSVFLVVSYLRLVGGMRFALLRAGLAQIVFLVLFGYAFFFEGYTGLTVTLGAVATLLVLMQMTGRVDWERAFAGSPPRAGGARSGDPEPGLP